MPLSKRGLKAPLARRVLRAAGKPVVEALEGRALLSGDPAIKLPTMPVAKDSAGNRYNETLDLGAQFFYASYLTPAQDKETLLLRGADPAAPSTQLFTSSTNLDELMAFNGKAYFFATTGTGAQTQLSLYAS